MFFKKYKPERQGKFTNKLSWIMVGFVLLVNFVNTMVLTDEN
ncbi:MAG: hypothetical protein RLZZ184_3570 [Cyanobacteriota bacterium]|jgi:hypothetical protein